MRSMNLKYKRVNTKVLFLLVLMCMISVSAFAQRSIRIGYIDTEYILENVPEYQEASSQLEAKVAKWKTEIDQRLSSVQQKKEKLNSESVLLTNELIKERQEEITIEENEILDYQQKRFGPNGDLMIQKKQLMQPVQDQIFAAVQEIAANKNFDFIFDKSADLTMLYSAERFDISEQVLRSITRASKRTQAQTKQERRAAEEEEIVPDINPEQEARAQALEDKKAEREKAIEERRQEQLSAREKKRAEIEAKKKKILEDRAKARQEKLDARNKANEDDDKPEVESEVKEAVKNTDTTKTDAKTDGKEVKPKTEKAPVKVLSDKEKRKQALEEKKRKILEARAKARKEQLEARKKTEDSVEAAKKDNDN